MKTMLFALGVFGAIGSPMQADCTLRLSFGNESATLTGASQAILQQVVRAYPGSAVRISGSADMVANATGNAALAAARAQAVQGFVLATGMQSGSVVVQRAPGDLLAAGMSRRVVQVQVAPCDPAVLGRSGVASTGVGRTAAAAGASGGLGAAAAGGLLALLAAGLLGGGAADATSTGWTN